VSEQLLVGQAVGLDIDGTKVAAVVAGMPPREVLVSLEPGAVAPPALVAGAVVTVSFASSLGLHQGRTTVLRVTQGRVVSVALARFGGITTSQRRQYFRVPASLNVTLLVITTSDAAMTVKEDPGAMSLDISGGGMRLDTVLPLAVGDLLKVTVEVPKGLRKSLPGELSCEAKVMRVESVVRRNRKLFCVGIEYKFAREPERDRWVQLTFDLQRGVQA